MKNKPKTDSGWSWMNALSGLLAGAFLGLGVCNAVPGKLTTDIDMVPPLALVALVAVGCASLAGGAKMQVPDEMVVLKKLVTLGRWVIVALALALATGLVISGYQYSTSHPVPPGWGWLD